MSRATRQIQTEDGPYRAVEAWRSPRGEGLCYLVLLAEPGGEPADDDRGDRRALLRPGEELGSLEEERLEEMVSGAVPLTRTERRFTVGDELWLAQNVGPVWAEGGVAEGSVGILFTSLEGELRRGTSGGGLVTEMTADELRSRREEAFDGERSAADPAAESDGSP